MQLREHTPIKEQQSAESCRMDIVYPIFVHHELMDKRQIQRNHEIRKEHKDKYSALAFTSPLLILLLGKYLEYSKERSGEQIMSSQIFLPLSSNIGLEQKSSSQTAALGTDVLLGPGCSGCSDWIGAMASDSAALSATDELYFRVYCTFLGMKFDNELARLFQRRPGKTCWTFVRAFGARTNAD